jgi:bifunctional UDP-N-acetylglucosamine pyrophosphorylase/glucosamine-1-phosphate N-acetyltransferase
MDNLVAVILAAGKGTRMKSDLVKVLHQVAGLPMLAYPIRAAKDAGCSKVIVVTGHQKGKVEDAFKTEDVQFAYQEKQLGSGHAVAVTEDLLEGFDGDALILCGDVPLITSRTLKKFSKSHKDSKAVVSVLSVTLDNPFGYGRILRDRSGNFFGIVEQRDATSSQKSIQEINTGLYCCKASFLFDAINKLGTDNDQGEYYLPDIVSIGVKQGRKVQAVETDDFQELKGINDRIDLAEAEKMMRQRILACHMRDGVTVVDPDSTYIDAEVKIGKDTIIYPNTVIRGSTTIGTGCVIEINCSVLNSVIGNDVHVKSSCVIDQSCVKDGVSIGPFAHLRSQAVIEEKAMVGTFVEVKKSCIGKGSKANHLTYIGDTTIGEDVNIGAGTITCNYDGKRKHPTVIEDGVFVGSNTSLVAPVKIGKKAVIGAGSTITRDVPEKALGITRTKQKNFDNFFREGSKKRKRKIT